MSLIKFGSRLRRIFSLVHKDSNFAQLKNQVDQLAFDPDEATSENKLPMALAEIVNEFGKHRIESKTAVDQQRDPRLDLTIATINET